MKFVYLLIVIFLLVGCQDRGGRQDSNKPVESSKISQLNNLNRIESLKGIWTIQVGYESANQILMNSVRLEFDGKSRIRIYQRDAGQISWVELLAIYTPYPFISRIENTLFLHDPVLYRNGTMQVALEPVDQNTFRFGYIRSDDFYTPQIIKEYRYYDRLLVRVNESSPFEKEINAGEPVSGKPLKDLPPPLNSNEDLIGSWSLESKTQNLSFKISFDVNNTGKIYLQNDNQTIVKSFEYVISEESREILLTSSIDYVTVTTQSIFAKISISDLSPSKLTVQHFRATKKFEHRRNGLNDASNMFGDSPLVFFKIR